MNRLTADDTFSIIFKINTLAVLVFMLLSGQAFAEQPKEKSSERMAFLQLNYGKSRDSCKLLEVGGALKKNYFEFVGKKDKENNYCVIQLTESDFNSNFRYCGLSSYNNKHNGEGACTFAPQNNGYAFLAGVPNSKNEISTQRCSFVCLTKTDGNKSR